MKATRRHFFLASSHWNTQKAENINWWDCPDAKKRIQAFSAQTINVSGFSSTLQLAFSVDNTMKTQGKYFSSELFSSIPFLYIGCWFQYVVQLE